MTDDPITVRGGGKHCPFCRAEVSKDEPNRVCADCLTRHHQECWDDYGGCSVYGCGGRDYLVQRESSEAVHPARSRTARRTRDERPVRTEEPSRDHRRGSNDAEITGRREEANTNARGGSSIGAILSGIAIFGAIAGVGIFILYRVTQPNIWNGKKPLSCYKSTTYEVNDLRVEMPKRTLIYAHGSCRLTIRGSTLVGRTAISMSRKAKLTMVGGRLVGASRALSMSGDSTAELRNVDVYGPSGIYVRGKARLKLIGGRIRGQRVALEVYSGAIVEVSKTTSIEGRIVRHRGGRIIGIPEQERLYRDEVLSRTYSAIACTGLLSCFKQHHHFGQIRVTVRGHVAKNGAVVSAHVLGTVPANVRTCLEATMRSKTIASYEGGPGALECRLGGTLLEGGISIMSSSQRFYR
ncbi:MAG: hypothetical protein KC609_26600 [Myxococcales bacterium]|nr:hypothetical protein [Myxococcales bacterium]